MNKKIAKFVNSRQDSFLTILEKQWRDWLLKPVTTLLWKIGISANHITIFGFILVAGAIFAYIYNFSPQSQLTILILAAISDAIDGPRARNHNQVTALGTWLDHIRDGFLIGWLTYLIYAYSILTIEWIIIIWTIQLIMIWLIMKDFLICLLREPSEKWGAITNAYSFDKLQASIIGRLQFIFWNIGYLTLFLYLVMPNENLILIGKSFLILAIVFATLNTYEVYTKK